MREYKKLVSKILVEGTRKEATRGGVDTIGIFNYNYQIDLRDGFPLLTTKPVSWKNIVIENLWFLSGDPTVDFLHKHGVKFWDPWVKPDGKVPSAYGNFWRRFEIGTEYGCVDQVDWALDKLKKNPATRQACISSWDPRNTKDSSLPPCHVFQVLNFHNNRLNLHLTQRSCDVALGLPYNIAGYSFLLELYSRFLGVLPGVFAHSIVDAHIYTKSLDGSNAEFDHIPGLTEQLGREERPLPTLMISDRIRKLSDIDDLVRSNASTDEILKLFELSGYSDYYPPIRFKPAV